MNDARTRAARVGGGATAHLEPGDRWSSSWRARLVLAAATMLALGAVLGYDWLEQRAGAGAVAAFLRFTVVALLVTCFAAIGRNRRPGRVETPPGPGEDSQRVDDLLAVVSHELRAPLTSMIGLMSTMQRGAHRFPPDRMAELAGMACEQGWRLERLVGDLLRDPRQGVELRPQRRDAVTTVREAVVALPVMTHNVVLSLPDAPLPRRVDHDALMRVVTNLVGNALKYTPAGSTVTVTLRPLASGLELGVTDDGPGMSPQDRSKAFLKFWRGQDDGGRGGLGLGLYLVRTLAAAHAGTVTLDEAPGGGCRFTVRFEELDAPVPASAGSH